MQGGAAAASAKAHAARSGAASAARRLFPDDDGGGSVSRGSSGASGSRNATGPDDADPAVEFAAVEFAEYEQERTSIFSRLGADRAAQASMLWDFSAKCWVALLANAGLL